LRIKAVAGSLALACLAACAAQLEDPERFIIAGECPDGVDVEADVLAVRCAGVVCHSPGDAPPGGVDLVSPGVAERVVGVDSPGCDGEVLVVPGDPDASLLVRKLGSDPPCGSRMPLTGQLGPGEETCIRDWIETITPGGE